MTMLRNRLYNARRHCSRRLFHLLAFLNLGSSSLPFAKNLSILGLIIDCLVRRILVFHKLFNAIVDSIGEGVFYFVDNSFLFC
ncbi:hypothetical protein GYMLUDRAFT_921026 [Collybiopsis luxurians FD-317 M1]|uniref:Uncharacterized protein n=1 Tax=Collybiopsis luxurians FD-317 M1 TaxID=944289 RepID=A0A0D0C7S0_9AGAR|nr:hypothetical protein GYMLUDRAFT_921026 [Collybiopsis luxurians FD-317 M1]